MSELTPSSLQKFISQNCGFSSHSEVKSSLQKAEQFEETKLFQESPILDQFNFAKKRDPNFQSIKLLLFRSINLFSQAQIFSRYKHKCLVTQILFKFLKVLLLSRK